MSSLLAGMLFFSAAMSVNAEEPAGIYGFGSGVTAAAEDRYQGFDPLESLDSVQGNESAFDIKAEQVTETGAVLRWQSEALYISYTLCRFNVITQQWDEYLTTTQSVQVLDGLTDNTEYRFAVFASNTGELLGTVTFTTGVKVPTVKITNRGSDAVTLSFGNAEENGTLVLYRKEEGGKYERLAAVTDGTYVDTAVKQASTYYYKARNEIKKEETDKKSRFSGEVKAVTLESFGLPDVSGATKTYAYYTAVTAKSSPQYKLLHSAECYTDEETGIRMVDGYYCVALGSYYGTKIGTKYKITLDTGKELNVILCDQKANRHTDENHQYARRNKDIMEFYVEKHKIPKGIRGDYGRLEQFKGKIVAIEKYVD